MNRTTFDKLKAMGIEFDDDFETSIVEPLEKVQKAKILPQTVGNSPSTDDATLNDIEIEFVKFLFTIRNAHIANNDTDSFIKYKIISHPNGYSRRERVFIVGKIFPVMNLKYKRETTDARDIEIIDLSISDRKSVDNLYWDRYGSKGIGIDNKRIVIFLPISYPGIDFPKLLFQFLTGDKIVQHTIGGEFPDYDTYVLALQSKAFKFNEWDGADGCWLKDDRSNNQNSERWRKGYMHIIKYKIPGRLAPFKQIYDFYNSVEIKLRDFKHKIKWTVGAKPLVLAMSEGAWYLGAMDGGSSVIPNDVETTLNELNLAICDFAITQFYDLLFGKYSRNPRVGVEAYEFDKQFITYEQQVVALNIYKKTPSETLRKLQEMVDKNIFSDLGLGARCLNHITPAFDIFKPRASITDPYFRTDLPLLMLYLDRHKPDSKTLQFKEHLIKLDEKDPANGTVDSYIKDIIGPYTL